MIVGHLQQLEVMKVNHPEASEAAVQVPISQKEGWEGHVMRVFHVAPGGHTPRHQHPWPHINFVLQGQATLHLNGEDHPISAGSYAFVPAGALHQFRNTGAESLSFICIVPEEGHQ